MFPCHMKQICCTSIEHVVTLAFSVSFTSHCFPLVSFLSENGNWKNQGVADFISFMQASVSSPVVQLKLVVLQQFDLFFFLCACMCFSMLKQHILLSQQVFSVRPIMSGTLYENQWDGTEHPPLSLVFSVLSP